MHVIPLSLLLVLPGPSGHEEKNLLQNAGAEEGSKTPKGWEKGAPVPGVEFLLDAKVAAEGKRSLSLKKTVERYFPIAEWRQAFGHDAQRKKLHVGALIKAEQAFKAILDAQFVDASGERTHRWAAYVGAREQGDPPANHDWLWYSGVVEVPAGTKEVAVGLQIYGPGQVWFDRMLASYVDDSSPETDAAQVIARPASEWGSLPELAPPGRPGGEEAAGEAGSRSESRLITMADDPQQRYFLIGPRAPAPADGFGLLVVLPGGDGSADFNPFVTEIANEALPASYVVAQAIAPAWKGSADLVWPKRSDHVSEVKRPAEDFIAAIVADVRTKHPLADRRIFLLGWSSGGPPCYEACLDKESPVRGALIAMSVFKPAGSLKGAKGRAFYLLHSPQDFISMSYPEDALRLLGKNGARTTLETYEGGHGWHGDVHGMIAKGVRWLEEQAGS